MRSLIHDGIWPAGQRLPSSRALAADLGISRNTAVLALEQLIADGWAYTRTGAGLFVSEEAARSGRAGPKTPSASFEAALAGPLPFDLACGSADAFPWERWRRVQSGVLAALDPSALFERAPLGTLTLRRAIADRVCSARGIDCCPDQIVVTPSTEASLDMLLRLLARPGNGVWIEDPGGFGGRAAARALGLRLVPVPVDEEGLCVAEGLRSEPGARIACLTPAVHSVCSAELSPRRRAELLAWAAAGDRWVIEDDSGADARFDLRPAPPPLCAEARTGRVVHLSSFERTLFPSLRIAYIVAPRAVAQALAEFRQEADPFTNVPGELVLAEFIERGYYCAHLRALRAVRVERRQTLIGALARYLPPPFRLRVPARGCHLFLDLPAHLSARSVSARLRTIGLAATPLSDFTQHGRSDSTLLLGFAAFAPLELRTAAEKLAHELSLLLGAVEAAA